MGLTDATVEEIVAACLSMVGLPYDGEPVDQLEHALQCAALAREEGDAAFVVAALLHDIARAPAVAGIPYDGPREHHGEAAARWLTPRVGGRGAWLAEQHVPAKRYLVATDPAYADGADQRVGADPDRPGRADVRRRGDGVRAAARLAT